MRGLFDTLTNAFKLPDLRKKLLFTCFILALYEIGGLVPVPGLDREIFTNLIKNWGQIGSLMDIISGGGLYAATIFAMGISPYINSSIIIQLLTVVIPALENLAKEGEEGRKKMSKITRYTAIGLAFLQSCMFCYSTRTAMLPTLPTWLNAILVVTCFTAGSCLVVFLGEKINEKGIGNGVSLIIFAGIVTRLPSMAQSLYIKCSDVSSSIESPVLGIVVGFLLFALITCISIGIIIFVLYVTLAERRIQVQYSKKTVGRKIYGGQSSYIPFKVNQSGVMPVIFTMSILSLPSMIVTLFWANSDNVVVNWFKNFTSSPFYYVFYFLLIIAFTFFYSLIQFNPIELSNNIQKNGGFIPGIRAGRPTQDYLQKIANRLNWADALYLSAVCLIPTLAGNLTGLQNVWFAGTSVLILVGVANDLIVQIESQLVSRNYKGFLD